MSNKVSKIIKIGVGVIGIGVTLITNYINDKDLDDKVSKAVAKELAKKES